MIKSTYEVVKEKKVYLLLRKISLHLRRKVKKRKENITAKHPSVNSSFAFSLKLFFLQITKSPCTNHSAHNLTYIIILLICTHLYLFVLISLACLCQFKEALPIHTINQTNLQKAYFNDFTFYEENKRTLRLLCNYCHSCFIVKRVKKKLHNEL